MRTLPRRFVYEAIDLERDHQDDKWGIDQPQSLPGLLLVMQAELNEAITGWIKNLPGKSAPLNEIVQVAATAVAALEKYGIEGCPRSTDDIPPRYVLREALRDGKIHYIFNDLVQEKEQETTNDSSNEAGRTQGTSQSREAAPSGDVGMSRFDWRECLGGGDPEQSEFLREHQDFGYSGDLDQSGC